MHYNDKKIQSWVKSSFIIKKSHFRVGIVDFFIIDDYGGNCSPPGPLDCDHVPNQILAFG